MIPSLGPRRSARSLAVAVGLSVLALDAVAMASPAEAATACPAQPMAQVMQLPHLRAALAAQAEGVIVAFGSSSTQGAMASDAAHTYPAVLQDALGRALRSAHIAVINRGIGGQDAPEELARLDEDVIAVRPQLVIWQVGANGALRHADPLRFGVRVTEGVMRLQAAGIDVILMDNQRSPRILGSADHAALEADLAHVAQDTGVNLFSRGRLMDAWSDEGAPPALFLATDGMHHNDLGYSCVAKALADRIVAALNAPAAVSASR
jgi:lysophospholipase L1-like esterase